MLIELNNPSMTNKAVTLQVVAAVLGTLGFCLSSAHAWQSDNGDGTFTNPPLYQAVEKAMF
jgi:hypothetical protein